MMAIGRVHIPASRQRGSAYVLVLTMSMIICVIGISALTAVRLRTRASQLHQNAGEAANYARSAVDMGLFWIGNDPSWRDNRSNGAWESDKTLGSGRYTLEVTDPDDSDLTNDFDDPVVVRGTGYDGDGRAVMQVTLEPSPAGPRPIAAATRRLGPVALWPLQDTSGTSAADPVGGYTGTYNNSVSLNVYDAIVSQSTAKFDGGNDFVAIPNQSSLQPASGSVSLWIKPDSVYGTQGLFSKDSASSFFNTHYLSIYLFGSTVRAAIADGSATTLSSSSGAITAGQWHHIVYTFGSGGLYLYVDGVQVDTSSSTTGLTNDDGAIALGVLTANASFNSASGWSNPYSGRLAFVGFFNYALTADQVSALYAAGATATRTVQVKPGSWKRVVNATVTPPGSS